MSRRTHGRNSFETNLDGAINDSQSTATVDSSTGLTQPGYFTIDPESPTLREYIKVAVIAGTAWSTITRGLAGSAAGAQAHADNVLIRSAPVHQHLEDTFDDIEDLEAADTGHFGGTDVADHPEATGSVRGFLSAADKTIIDAADHGVLSGLTDDDHTQYPLKSIATTKGDLWVATGAGVLVRVGVGTDDQVLIADAGEASGVKWGTPITQIRVVKQAQQVETGTTLINDDDLKWAVGANEDWIFSIFVLYRSSGQDDFKHGIDGPAGFDVSWGIETRDNLADILNAFDTPGGPGTAQSFGGAGGGRQVVLTGTFTTAGTSGTAQYQWAQNADIESGVVVEELSHLIATRV